MLGLAGFFFHHWLFHPMAGKGYQFFSGIGSDVSELALLGGLIAYLRHHQCAVRGCWRMSWATHPEHGVPVCARHHPKGGIDKEAV